MSILNRTARVGEDGGYVLPNVPGNFGQVRARATCVRDGVTVSGESDLFELGAPGTPIRIPAIHFGPQAPIPSSLRVEAPITQLHAVGETTQLAVTATFSDRSTGDYTGSSTGTNYNSSNAGIISVTPGGLVTGVSAGTAVISALNEGALGIIRLRVVLTGDSDGDGIPDDLELENGLDPNDPIDALEDLDADGLTNWQELVAFFPRVSDIRRADSDGDGIRDDEEMLPGEDGFQTDPMRADTDGDKVRDRLEIQTGSDPTDPADFNLAAALTSLVVSPKLLDLTVNTILPENSEQLTVTGTLLDGFPIDLTAGSTGTIYESSDLLTCQVDPATGRVSPAADQGDSCTISVSNSGFSDAVTAFVDTFAPIPLAALPIPGFANNVDVSGEFAYVAAGAAGLQVANVADREVPSIVASFDTAGNANDVKIVNDIAFVADGTSGLVVLNVSDPRSPYFLGAVDTLGVASDVVVRGNLAFIADGSAGLQIIDVSDPVHPARLGLVSTGGTANGVDVSDDLALAVVAQGSSIRVLNIEDPTTPVVVGTAPAGNARDVVVRGSVALVADRANSLTSIDLGDPTNPVVLDSTTAGAPDFGGLLVDVAAAGRFAFGADIFFANGIPIVDVTVANGLLGRDTLDFPPGGSFRDDNGTGIAVDGSFVYLTAAQGLSENAANGNSQLYIGQYLKIEDTRGNPPTVAITSPAPGETVIEESTIRVTAVAQDDIGVAGVEFLADGASIGMDTSPPYEVGFTVPLGASSVTLDARAADFGPPNVGDAADVVVAVAPDPLTMVIGSVVDIGGSGVPGAVVEARGSSSTTDAAGVFSIQGVPTISETLRVAALADVGGRSLRGRSESVTPIRAGVTDVGEILVVENTALDLDGSGDYVDIPGNLRSSGVTGAFTITVWIKASSTSGFSMLLEDGTNFSTGAFYLGVSPAAQRVFARLNTTSTSFFNDQIPTPAFADRWANLAYAYDGSTMRLYLDGEPFFSRAITGQVIEGNRNLRVGFPSGENFYKGLVDELRIWNVALTGAEIQDTVNRRLTGAEPGLVGYWDFDDAQGNAATDLGPSGRGGTLFGDPTWIVSDLVLSEPGQPEGTSISPDSGAVTGGTRVTIEGANFTTRAEVTIGGTRLQDAVVIDSSTIGGVVPPGVAGVAEVFVTDLVGTAQVPGGFSYLSPLGDNAQNPASSCLDIQEQGKTAGDGRYWIQLPGRSVEMTCDFASGGGGWTRVAALDTTIGYCGNPSVPDLVADPDASMGRVPDTDAQALMTQTPGSPKEVMFYSHSDGRYLWHALEHVTDFQTSAKHTSAAFYCTAWHCDNGTVDATSCGSEGQGCPVTGHGTAFTSKKVYVDSTFTTSIRGMHINGSLCGLPNYDRASIWIYVR